MTRQRIAVAIGVAAIGVSVWVTTGAGAAAVPAFAAPRETESWPVDKARAREVRDDALQRARVWHELSAADVAAFEFGANPPDPSGLLTRDVVDCRFVADDLGGTTPKFTCVLRDGEVVKVKYGRNPEIQSELAASRLLTGLGFGADRMYLVPQLRCYGCPPLPYQTSRVLGLLRLASFADAMAPDGRVTEFAWVALERRMAGAPIKADGDDGWAWYELHPDERRGGATRAESDALRLMASFLVHWDNKQGNQRLICLADPEGRDRPCPQPFAFIHDLGASFGPHKVNLEGWRRTPVFVDPPLCRVSMRHLPFLGATFVDTEISEDGRALLARLLTAMSDRQIADLFAGARFGPYERGRWFGPAADEKAWVAAFQDRVRQVVEAGPC
jgi:hypothetical protein